MAARIAFIYLFLTSLWIVASDGLLIYLSGEGQMTPESALQIERMKGLLFMVVTSILLYLVLRHFFKKEKEAIDQYARLFRKNPNPMFIYDLENLRLLAVNEAALLGYGFSEEAFLNMHLLQIYAEEERDRLKERLRDPEKAYASGEIWQHRKKDGTTFFVKTYAHVSEFEQRPACLLSAIDVHQSVLARQENRRLSTELTTYKDRLDSILASVNDVIWSCDPETLEIIYINDACTKLYGYTPEEFKSSPELWGEIIHPKDRASFQKSLQQLLQKGKNESEYRVIRKDGKERYILDRSVVTYTEAGAVERLNGVATDITNLRHAQQRTRQYLQRIDEILNTVTDGFFSVDRQWRFTYVNKASEGIMQRNREELLGQVLWEHFPEAMKLQFFTEYHKVMQERESVQFEEYFPPLGKWFSVTAHPVREGVSVFFQDVTESKLLRQHIIEERNKLQTLINSMNELVWSIDKNMELTIFNDIFARSSAHLSENLEVGDSVIMPFDGRFASKQDNDRWRRHYRKALNGEQHQVIEQFRHPKLEDIQYLLVNFYPIRDVQGEVIGVSCSAQNTTARKRNELKIERQNKALRRIAWRQSHDARAPLTNIMAMTEILLKSSAIQEETEERRIVLEHLEQSAQELDDSIRDIIEEISRLDDDLWEDNDEDEDRVSSNEE